MDLPQFKKDRSAGSRTTKLKGKITAQTRSTNDLIAPISAATSKSAGVQILSAYAPECCISSESFPAPPDVPGISRLVAGDRYMEIYFNLNFRSMPTITTERALPVLYYVVKTVALDIDEVIPDAIGNFPSPSPITVTGLTNGRRYRFTLYTVNALGLSNSGSTATAGGPSALIGVPATYPDAPIITSLTRSGQDVTVNFTSLSDGGSPITRYVLNTYDLDGNNNIAYIVEGSSSPFIVRGLVNGQSYKFTVSSRNSIGASDTSAFSDPITIPPAGSVPTAPLLLRTLADNGQAYIYFAPQNNGGSTILKYKYSIDGGASYTDYTLGDIVSPILITTGLTNEQTYTVRLKAVNSVGESAESNTMTVTPTNTSTAATATLWLDPTDTTTYTRSGTVITAAKLKTDASTVNSTSVGSGITYDSASAGGVFDFNGGGGAVINFPAYDFGSTITVTAWINPRVKHSINGLIANGTAWSAGTSGQGFRFQWNWWVSPATSSSRTIQSQLGALLTPSTSNLDDDYSPTDIIQYDVWQHVGYQLDTINNTIIFFYNGIPTLITTDGRTPSPITMAGLPFVIGGLRGGSYTMNAKLGDLKVFNTLLDATQIKAEFDATKGRFGL